MSGHSANAAFMRTRAQLTLGSRIDRRMAELGQASPEQVRPAKNRDGKCHRRRVVVRDASRQWGVNLVLPPADECCKSRAEARCA
jgi:hypothetical protein